MNQKLMDENEPVFLRQFQAEGGSTCQELEVLKSSGVLGEEGGQCDWSMSQREESFRGYRGKCQYRRGC